MTAEIYVCARQAFETQEEAREYAARLFDKTGIVAGIEAAVGRRQVKQNAWGNWNGYVGRYKVREFGTRANEALEWAGE